ncbi:MAG: phosphate signaling complex protein PhoU [Bdellovibrionales bacterium]|nr:phosphate signaling complex protein PhoU [Bdellovibrionales bacterium]
MSKHLQNELENLNRDLLYIASLVKENVRKSMVAFYERRVELAREVIEADEKIDQKEVQVEEECLKLLALHQPVAQDLRFIAVVMKVNNDLERMGDSAVGIARRAIHIVKEVPCKTPGDLKVMTEKAVKMVDDSLDAFIRKDVEAAKAVSMADDEVDVLQKNILKQLRKDMESDPKTIPSALDVFTITRRIERIADYATNICEDIIYMVEGNIVRHGYLHKDDA